jgi:hypothetical protein
VIRTGALLVVSSIACGARSELDCDVEPCLSAAAIAAERCHDRGDAAPSCTGSGLIDTLADDCIDDGGDTDSDDSLEIYCVDGTARFCLSHEVCPWRAGTAAVDDTCSASGLSASYMANTHPGCDGFLGYDVFCCFADGSVGLHR